MINRQNIGQSLSYLVMGLLGAGMMVTYQAWANNDGSNATEEVPRVIPYQGVLELNGVPYNGPMDVRFALFGNQTLGNAGSTDAECLTDTHCLWSEEYSGNNAQQVYQGRFNSTLGSVNSIESTIYDAGPLFLGIQVRGPQDQNWVALDNRQQITPVPFAFWSTQSTNLNVGNNAQIDGSLTVNTHADVLGNITVGGVIQTHEDELTIRQGDENVFLLNNTGDAYIRKSLRVSTLGSRNGVTELEVQGDGLLTGDLMANNFVDHSGLNLTTMAERVNRQDIRIFRNGGHTQDTDHEIAAANLSAQDWACMLRGVQAHSNCALRVQGVGDASSSRNGNWELNVAAPNSICRVTCIRMK